MAATSAAVRAYLQRQYDKVASGFASLARSPPELWKAYALKFLDSYAYFSFALVFTLFLSDDFGMSDVQAGTIYGAWGALITIFGLFTGTVIDRLGVAMCLRIGFVLSFLTRVAIFATTSKELLLVCNDAFGAVKTVVLMRKGKTRTRRRVKVLSELLD